MRRDGERDSRIHASELLDHDGVVKRREAGAAILRRPHRTHEAQLAGLGEDLAREFLLLVPLARVRPDLALREITDGLLEELLLLGQAEIQEDIPRRS